MLKRTTDVAASPRACAGVMRALGDETRMRILISLLASRKCVIDLVREMRRGQPHVSHHLRILRDAGLVQGVRDGRRVCYRVAPGIRRAVRRRGRQGLDFGCCRLTFPQVAPAASTRRRSESRSAKAWR